jgi:transposase
VKSVAQQDLQAAHRVRAEVSNQRKAKANQIREMNPNMYEAIKAERAMGNWRAHSPLWPDAELFEAAGRGRIYVSSRTSKADAG